MDLDLNCVASFLVLLEERHYGRAARRLHVSSPGLTKRIHVLERQVGVPLVLRDSAGTVGPTAAGGRFAREAVPLLAQARAAHRAAREVERTVVRLGVPGPVGDHPSGAQLAVIARELAAHHPGLRLRCHGVPYAELLPSVLDGRVDVLWTAADADGVDHRGLVSTPIASSVARVGVVGRRHPLAEARSVRAEEFAALPMLDDPSLPRQWMALWWLGDVRPEGEARLVPVPARDLAGVLQQVVTGPSVTVIHAPIARALPASARTLQLTGAAPVTYHATARSDDRRSSVRALVDVLRRTAPAGAEDAAAAPGAGRLRGLSR